MRLKFIKIFFYVLFVLFFFHCSSNEYRLIGISSRSQETFYYGNDFTVSAWNLNEERLIKIKHDLKNSLAVQNLENPKEKWKEVSDISLKDGNYILFQIFPDTRVPNDFLKFQFLWNDSEPKKIYSYYTEILETSIRGRYYYPVGGFYGGGGGFMYPINSRQTEQVSQKIVHSYNFLLLFKNPITAKNSFKVTTPSGNQIEFELNIQ